MTHEAGKGDKQRPTNHRSFAENFEKIFGKKENKAYFLECDRCGKKIWFDPTDSYSGIHTCTPKENQSVSQHHTEATKK